MAINKIIHCGHFGDYSFSALNMRCMASWQVKMPDWQVMLWNDSNIPINDFTNKANPINRSNYMKYWTLYNFGGVFMDYDVEVVRPFDTTVRAFVGFQKTEDPQDCINTAVIGSEKGGRFIAECLRRVEQAGGDCDWPVELGCGIPTAILYEQGMKGVNVEQVVNGVTVYAKERLYPWGYQEQPSPDKITKGTFSIHHWEGSWKKE